MRKDELQRTRLSRRGSLGKKEQGNENKSINTDRGWTFQLKTNPFLKLKGQAKNHFIQLNCVRLYNF